jgi:hypothetical protein
MTGAAIPDRSARAGLAHDRQAATRQARTASPEVLVTKLCILMAALAVIARARVAVLPGWVVPAPAVFLAAALALCAAVTALVVLRVRAEQARRPSPEPAPEVPS